MARLVWDNETERKYTTGVSKGVFFDGDGKGHAWSGLISVTEKPQTNEPTAIYNSLGQKYDQYGNVAEKKHGLSCYTYPEAMDEFLGYEYLEEVGFSVDERPPKKFHMAYRVELGNGLYEIHVLLNQIATFGETNRSTLSNSPSLSTITMNLTGASDPRYGTSHIVLDSRLPITESAETILFGDKFNDSNINDFLEAEPTWETVAVNYAPIIEPDYDNYVWLGKENLVRSNTMMFETDNQTANVAYNTSYINSTIINNPDAYLMTMLGVSKTLVVGNTYTVTVKAGLPPGRDAMMLYDARVLEGGASKNTYLGNLTSIGDGLYRLTFTYPDTIVDDTAISFVSNYLRLYGARSQKEATDNPGDLYIEWVKLEAGSIPTPWTPALNDPDQKPRPTDPHPENYKPGVKKLSLAHPRPQLIQVYYDELYGGVGVSPYIDSASTKYGILYTPYISDNTNVKASVKTATYDVTDLTYASHGLGLRYPERASVVPLDQPVTEVLIEPRSMSNGTFSSGIIFAIKGSYWHFKRTYANIFLTLSGYEGKFFDANSTPPNKGTKYVRVETKTHDYTLKQELRLRSKSRVRIYDQTSYDYWLEADDSQLIRQNETFTFSGPQAEITGDTFTIDDEILGSEGF